MEILPKDFLLPSNFKVKAVIKKVVEATYSPKDGLKLKAALKKGSVKATVDANGKVTYTGTLGRYSLRGDPDLKALGSKFKYLSVTFSLAENGDIKYDVTVSLFDGASFTFSSQFDIEKLIFSGGHAKKAYDAVKNREQTVKEAIREALP